MELKDTSNNAVKVIWVTPYAEYHIGYCARVSNPSNQQSTSVAKLLRYCINHKHWSVFEMGSMCVEIDTSRAISAQILRHRSFHFQEFSQRYAAVDQTGVHIYAARRQDMKDRQNSIDDLPVEIQQEWLQRQQDNWRVAFEHYTWALDHTIAKECARFVLPMGSKTRIYMQATIRDWIHYLLVRTDPSAQKEHRDIALQIQQHFISEFPTISTALGWVGTDGQLQLSL